MMAIGVRTGREMMRYTGVERRVPVIWDSATHLRPSEFERQFEHVSSSDCESCFFFTSIRLRILLTKYTSYRSQYNDSHLFLG